MRIFLLTIITIIAFAINPAKSQDIHMSHIHSGPLLYNPAMTGVFDADVRLIANYKSQWQAAGTNYRTCYGSAEIKTKGFGGSTSALGIGLEVFSDVAGDLDYSNKGAQLSISGIKVLDGRNGNKIMTAGIKAGYVYNSFDPTKIIAFDDETSIYDNANPQTGYFDLSAGFAWMHQLNNESDSYYLGVSASHVNRPQITFNLADNSSVGNELYRKYIIHGGGDFTLKGRIGIQPSFIFADQGPNREILVGSFLSYNKYSRGKKIGKHDKDYGLQFGGWVRSYYETDGVKGIDAIILAAKSTFGSTTITFSYDMNISTLTLATIGRGGPELSFIQLLNIDNPRKRRVVCPAFL